VECIAGFTFSGLGLLSRWPPYCTGYIRCTTGATALCRLNLVLRLARPFIVANLRDNATFTVASGSDRACLSWFPVTFSSCLVSPWRIQDWHEGSPRLGFASSFSAFSQYQII
jgi:hypothetical protein